MIQALPIGRAFSASPAWSAGDEFWKSEYVANFYAENLNENSLNYFHKIY